jgi:hypothetical protein
MGLIPIASGWRYGMIGRARVTNRNRRDAIDQHTRRDHRSQGDRRRDAANSESCKSAKPLPQKPAFYCLFDDHTDFVQNTIIKHHRLA